ncbi:MAG: hypothetical protein GXO83_06220 [Chlorobi bacterium]|nr:hypothetical protein [Chlorobiota bacterium]
MIVLNKACISVDTLYNFNLDPGDTCFSSHGYYIIEDTLTKYFAGKNRKGQTVNFESDTIYTGVGSKKGGLLVNQYYFATGAFQSLICYYENDSLLYHNPDYESCYIDNTTSVNKLWSDHEIKVYPNPAGRLVSLRFEKALSQPVDFVLYDASAEK